MRKRKEKERKEGKEERKQREKEKQSVERKEGKRRNRKRKRENFSASESSKFDSSRTKVGARSAIYMWTPKSWSFDKLRKVGVLSYLSYTLFKCFVDDCVGLRP